ncbi:IclR family transcriptional regulator domain-containing protein [Pectobacterium odoriferum]|uniref:IclR family transcriptional regulator domain-containing protein n=1 Tax=Pectobacterium odoriferum TaxID=78398 RepID=UPI001374DC5C
MERATPCSVANVDDLIEQLNTICAEGFAYDIEEHTMGSCAIGLPLMNPDPLPLAISVVVPISRFHTQKCHRRRSEARC